MSTAGRVALCAVLCCTTLVAACGGGLLEPKYEYEEEIYLDLDGSATLNVNASVPALVALHGADLPTDPRARLDRDKVRALFTAPSCHFFRYTFSPIFSSRSGIVTFPSVEAMIMVLPEADGLFVFIGGFVPIDRGGDA